MQNKESKWKGGLRGDSAQLAGGASLASSCVASRRLLVYDDRSERIRDVGRAEGKLRFRRCG